MTRLIAALLLLASPAAAGTIRDAATGLAVTPPPGYAAAPSEPALGANRPVFDVKRPTDADSDTGCRVTIADAPANRDLTQGQINAFVATPQYRALITNRLAGLFDIQTVETVPHGALTGVQIVFDHREDAELPARALEIRTMLVILETPRHRVSLACVGERGDFEARLGEFRAVLAGVVVP